MIKARPIVLSAILSVCAATATHAQSNDTFQEMQKKTSAELCGSADNGNCELPGLLLLYPAGQEALVNSHAVDIAQGECSIWRRGTLAGANGNLKIRDVQRFMIISCPVRSPNGQIAHAISSQGIYTITGPLLVTNSDDDVEWTGLEERSYVMKISYFNNETDNQRGRDLQDINEQAAKRKNGWSVDATMKGPLRPGKNTPTIVDLIYYDSPEAGEQFRKNNPDILQMVGAFNKKYLSGFAYLPGTHDNK